MAKDPAILFYTSDFIIGTLTMTWAEKGQYITVLCIMHQNGRLTKEQIDNVLRGETLPSVLEKFSIDEEGRYYNSRLEEEKQKRTNFAASRRKSLDINNGDMVHVYLLFDRFSGNYKIGSSKYPMLRLSDMHRKNPDAIMYWKTEGLVERVNEKKLHDHFIDKKVKNDWFKLNEKDIDYIKEYFRTEARTVNENENVIENRKLEFESEVDKYQSEFSAELIQTFKDYWLEMNKSKTKFRFEGQKFFDFKKRLGTFKRNQNSFTPDNTNGTKLLSLEEEIKKKHNKTA